MKSPPPEQHPQRSPDAGALFVGANRAQSEVRVPKDEQRPATRVTFNVGPSQDPQGRGRAPSSRDSPCWGEGDPPGGPCTNPWHKRAQPCIGFRHLAPPRPVGRCSCPTLRFDVRRPSTCTTSNKEGGAGVGPQCRPPDARTRARQSQSGSTGFLKPETHGRRPPTVSPANRRSYIVANTGTFTWATPLRLAGFQTPRCQGSSGTGTALRGQSTPRPSCSPLSILRAPPARARARLVPLPAHVERTGSSGTRFSVELLPSS